MKNKNKTLDTQQNTNKGGRPNKDTPMQSLIAIRFSKEDKELLRQKAKAANMNASMFIRNAVKKANVTPVNMEAVIEYRGLRRVLVHIENDINQLTKRAIYAKDKDGIGVVMDELAHSKELIVQLKSALEQLKNQMKG